MVHWLIILPFPPRCLHSFWILFFMTSLKTFTYIISMYSAARSSQLLMQGVPYEMQPKRWDLYKYWNKHIRIFCKPPQLVDTSNIAELFSTSSVPCFSFIGCQLCNNSVIDTMDFSQEEIYVLDNLFFTDEARFHLSGYINSQNNGIWSAKIITCTAWKSFLWNCQRLEN